VGRDTGFIGVRVTQFLQILTNYKITTAGTGNRLMTMDYKDPKFGLSNFRDRRYRFFGVPSRAESYERCGTYVVNKLEPIYK
jgi:hypothetical protein